jgi:hypothetical protein
MKAGNDKGKRGATWFLVALSTFALLIWAKLRLVTGVPRTAYAEPEQRAKPKPDRPAGGVDSASDTPKQ